MGLLDIAAGAAAGGGAALEKVGFKQMDEEIQRARDERLQEFQKELDVSRDAMAGAREEKGDVRRGMINAEAATVANDRTVARDAVQHTRAVDLQKAGFGHDTEMRAAQNAFTAGESALARNLTREQIASQEKIHKADRDNAMAVAKIGGTVQSDPEGNVYMIGKDGTTRQIMDPNDKNKPLKSAKDLTPQAKAFVDVLRDRLKALDANMSLSPEEKDKKAEALNAQLLLVMSPGGVGAVRDAAGGASALPPRDKLVVGKEYDTPRGKATWDGKNFVAGDKPAAAAAKTAGIISRPRSEMDNIPPEALAKAEATTRIRELSAVLDNPAIKLPQEERDKLTKERDTLTSGIN